MEYKQIVDLIKLVNKTSLTEVTIKEGEFRLNIKTKNYQKTNMVAVHETSAISPAIPTPVTSATEIPSPKPAVPDLKPVENDSKDTSDFLSVKSPIVGTFYRSSSPDKPPFIKVGDTVEKGDVVCIVEAMKLFNEIESEVSGKVVKVLVEDASPVEYDQVLFLVDPS